MNKLIRFALPAMLALGAQLPAAALAQDKALLAPADAAAPAAPLAYDSAFAGYRSDKDNPAVGWKESNERVTQPHDEHAGHDMGAMKHGHHGHAATPAPAPAPAASPAPAPKANDPHHGHQHKE
ncbi:hypothetical protein ACFSQU_14975 [Massilia sp. GCM10020059]|uniref:Uncharacterized protein n=1 Tax=Massilia agrisoli TaxID=2892444 RepID=A0ABS8IQD5_9BURK|nr:hypothetical protein [Massilia agrisoli]MCC6070837.1 hypothetical protein [Massilia agrisoli]